jgi:hypothetical protein
MNVSQAEFELIKALNNTRIHGELFLPGHTKKFIVSTVVQYLIGIPKDKYGLVTYNINDSSIGHISDDSCVYLYRKLGIRPGLLHPQTKVPMPAQIWTESFVEKY